MTKLTRQYVAYLYKTMPLTERRAVIRHAQQVANARTKAGDAPGVAWQAGMMDIAIEVMKR